MSMKDNMEAIEKFLELHPNRWFESSQIVAHLPHIDTTNIYLAISRMARVTKRIQRRTVVNGRSFEYAHQPDKPSIERSSRKKIDPYLHEPLNKTVRWSDDEKMILAREMVRLRRETPYISTSDMIRRAQACLPSDRRRHWVRKAKDILWMDEFIEKVKREEIVSTDSESQPNQKQQPFNSALHDGLSPLKGLIQTAPQTSLQPTLPPLEIPKPQDKYTEKVIAAVEKQSEKITEPAKIESLESFGTDALFGEVVKRLGVPIKTFLIDLLASPEIREALTIKTNVEVNHHHYHHHTTKAPESFNEQVERRSEDRVQEEFTSISSTPSTEKKPHIVVVGPLAQQARELEKSYPQVKFTILNGHEYQQVRSVVKNCDRAIGMTKFMNHSMDGVMKNVGGDRYIRVDGGLSSIRHQLDIWISQKIIPASI